MFWQAWGLFASATVFFLLVVDNARSETIRYDLASQSMITLLDSGPTVAETLQGSFYLTLLPVPDEFTVEAITDLDWRSESFVLRGSGFAQRLGTDAIAMVIDSKINGEPVLLTSGRRQRSTRGRVHVLLRAASKDGPTYLLDIVAFPGATDAPDRDHDAIPDTHDNCPDDANADQTDSDNDRIGNACDRCADSPLATIVDEKGCSPMQLCPCDGPTPEKAWPNQKVYLKCVWEKLKAFKSAGRITRQEMQRVIKEAIKSGCGRQLLATR